MKILNLLTRSIVVGGLSGGIIGASTGMYHGLKTQLKEINSYPNTLTYVVDTTSTIGGYGLLCGGAGIFCGMVWPISVSSALVHYFKHE